jgi:hypothetical protein
VGQVHYRGVLSHLLDLDHSLGLGWPLDHLLLIPSLLQFGSLLLDLIRETQTGPSDHNRRVLMSTAESRASPICSARVRIFKGELCFRTIYSHVGVKVDPRLQVLVAAPFGRDATVLLLIGSLSGLSLLLSQVVSGL